MEGERALFPCPQGQGKQWDRVSDKGFSRPVPSGHMCWGLTLAHGKLVHVGSSVWLSKTPEIAPW